MTEQLSGNTGQLDEGRLAEIENSLHYSRVAEREGLPYNIHEGWRVEIDWLITELKAARSENAEHRRARKSERERRKSYLKNDEELRTRIAELEGK